MAGRLLLSTATTIQMGPHLNEVDGVTPETGLSPAVELSKANGVFVARNSADAISHDADGYYRVPLDTTDTNTLGRLIAKSIDSANHAPVFHEFEVVQAPHPTLCVPMHIGPIKKDTAFSATVGPFISISTGLPLEAMTVTAITGQLSKGGGAAGATITITAAGGDNDLTHIGNGLWALELSATDTNTNGWLTVLLRDDDVFYPVVMTGFVYNATLFGGFWEDYIPANIMAVNADTAVFTAGTEKLLKVDVHAISGDETDADDLGAAIDNTNNYVYANVKMISDDATAADNLELAADGTGYDLGSGAVTVDVTKISGDSGAADALESALDQATLITVDDAGFVSTTTEFETDETEATADHFNGRSVLWVSGALARQQRLITDYALSGGRGHFTVETMTEAPANGDTFRLI